MIISIEFFVFLLIVLFIILWLLIDKITRKIKLWRYKPENDKGRSAEEWRKRINGQDRTIRKTESDIARITEPAERSLLQDADTVTVRQTSSGNGTNGRKFFNSNPFTRRRR